VGGGVRPLVSVALLLCVWACSGSSRLVELCCLQSAPCPLPHVIILRGLMPLLCSALLASGPPLSHPYTHAPTLVVEYYDNNIVSTLVLLEVMAKHGVYNVSVRSESEDCVRAGGRWQARVWTAAASASSQQALLMTVAGSSLAMQHQQCLSRAGRSRLTGCCQRLCARPCTHSQHAHHTPATRVPTQPTPPSTPHPARVQQQLHGVWPG
jgi:hypothetical protein